MASQQIADHKEGAEIYHGESLCKQKSHELLSHFNLPKGLLPVNDIIEFGHNRATGFVWFKQNKKSEHKFRAIGSTASYDTEITLFMEDRRMRKAKGVKVKELMLWVTITDIYISDKDPEKITFVTFAGISKTHPVSAFELEEGN